MKKIFSLALGLMLLAGAVSAQALSRFLVASLGTSADPVFLDLAPDWRVLGFAAGMAVLDVVEE